MNRKHVRDLRYNHDIKEEKLKSYAAYIARISKIICEKNSMLEKENL